MTDDYSAMTDTTSEATSSTPIGISALAVGVAVFVTLTYLKDQSLPVQMLFGIPLAHSLGEWTFALVRRVRVFRDRRIDK